MSSKKSTARFEFDSSPGESRPAVVVAEILPAASDDTSRALVRDAETGDWVTVTPEMQARAASARRHIEMATLVKAVALKAVADERLYLADGCSSFKDWVHVVLGTSYASAKDYVRIGRRVAPLMPALGSGDGLSGEVPQLAGGQSIGLDSERVESVSSLGLVKLSQLTRLDEARFADVVERGVVTLDGETFTLEELQEMSSRELASRVRDETAALKDKLQELRAEADTLRAEKAALLQEKDAASAELADARELEAELRPRALSIAAKREAITTLREETDRLNERLIALGVTPDDPTTLQEDCVHLIAKLEGMVERVRHHYHDVQAALIGLGD